ncbi:Non-specific serine/threonine protein kinase [Sulfidibacter corallicola]|uniref:Serine/threonine protein kinase n=1 Tax=Sulfidibacter corallicola TaxID=2818388 RepID=A0A8A4TRP7_SULCO|nr:serine/threonine-protein kinase [Sulfidibacter corallicola]QTD51698.1 serine/threonine protein kinase [Sulfidibacter corallicola]
MSPLNDGVLNHLLRVIDEPDLSSTKYRMHERLASGGMGTIYLAYDAELERPAAVKVLHVPDPSGELEARLIREARIMARLEHPGIVPIHEVGRLACGRVFCAMKYVRGQPLDRYVRDVPDLQTRLRLFLKICETMAFAHDQGIIHRDLKPANIMVGPFGEVLVMDWGLAKSLGTTAGSESAAGSPMAGDDQLTQGGVVAGTPAFMAPEQADGRAQAVDVRADVYGLGGVLYFLLTGKAPGTKDREHPDGQYAPVIRPRFRDSEIPKALDAVCMKALATLPEHRYANGNALAEEISDYLDGRPLQAYRPPLWSRAAAWCSRNKVLLALLGAYLLMRFLLIFLRKS